ncbi:unnamed protein product, partial [Ascophyllum nodosum]
LFIPPTAIGSVPSLSGHAIAYRWRSLPRVRRYSVISSQGSSSNGCCLFRHHHGPIDVRLSFPTPTNTVADMCDIESIGIISVGKHRLIYTCILYKPQWKYMHICAAVSDEEMACGGL